MTSESSHPIRVHIGLTVADMEASIAFYRALLQVEPAKVRPGYAKFESSAPHLNLALNEGQPTSPGTHSHFGIELPSTEAVNAAQQRLQEAGLLTRAESQVTCCHAVQDKVWVTDPDRNAWEFFVVTDADAGFAHPVPGDVPAQAPEPACCAPACCR
ncbi:MAG: ArsI/CadI family heavy metal resistance metalloenzyme [Myxococcota bacterium]